MAWLASASRSLACSRGSWKRPEQPTERYSENVITTRRAERIRIRAMSESSLPPFVPARFRIFLRTFRRPRWKERLGRVRARVQSRRNADVTEPVQMPTLEARAEQTVCEYLDAHASNLERAARLKEKAERLEKAGTPSESARNRAERARDEVVAGLAALRASFVGATEKGGHAFDRVLERRCPAFAPRQVPYGRLR